MTLISAQYLIHRQVSDVFHACYSRLAERESVRVFLGGGGMKSDYYSDTIPATYDVFRFDAAGIPRFTMIDVPLPSDFDMSGIDEAHFHRFAIAYGLSIPDYQAQRFNLPRQFPNHNPPPEPRRWTPETSQDDG